MAERQRPRRGPPDSDAAAQQRPFRPDPEGPWAWFRLLDQSDLERGNSPDRFTLRLRIDGSSIACELRASSAFNPFKSRVVSGFSLPERL